MKFALMIILAGAGSFIAWFEGGARQTVNLSKETGPIAGLYAECGCTDEADLRNRLRAIDSAIAELQKQVTLERWQDEFTPSAYNSQIVPLINSALGRNSSGRFTSILGKIDPNSCAIHPESSPVSSCLASLIAKNVEPRKEACENWKNDDGRTGNDYRTGSQMLSVLEDDIAGYRNEKAFIEEELVRLSAMRCQNRNQSNRSSTPIPPTTPPGTTATNRTGTPSGTAVPRNVPPIVIPPGTLPPGTVITGGIPMGFPPTGGPPVLPPIPPPDDPPIIFPPIGTGGPIGIRRTSGYVQYILELPYVAPFGIIRYKSNSRIPFTIIQNRVTGGGQILTEIDTSGSTCKVLNYDGTVDVTVAGRQVGNQINVTVSRVASGGTGLSFADKVANVRLECEIEGGTGFAQSIPNMMSNLTPPVRQSLQLPPVGGRPTTADVTPPHLRSLGGRIILRVYRP